MKNKVISALLITMIAAQTLTGCGAKATDEAATAPSYIEPEYPEEAYYEASETNDTYDRYETDESYAASETYEPSASYEDTECAATESDAYCGSEESLRYAKSADPYADTLTYPPYTGEKYKSIAENGFCDVSSAPLSTFGADIDTASYSNLRRMINDGYCLYDIPEGSVRTEELVNYFNFDYKEPGRGDAFAVNASIIDCPWNKDTKLVNLGIKAKEEKDIEDIPSNIVFLIDVSGSMKGYDKLPLLKMGMDMLVDNLSKNDRVSIVTYASSSDVILAGERGNEHSKIKRAINSLEANGSTNGGRGIIDAYKLAEKYFIEGGNNRVIMATDGDLNVGITSEEELETLIDKKKSSGVFLSVLGFGTGNYNEVTLQTLADKGNGNYSYIDSLSEAKKVLIDEFNSTLFTVAKDVKFQIEFNPRYVSEYRLVGYENRKMAAKDFRDDTKDGGEIGSGHTMTVMYEIKLAGDDDTYDDLRYQNTDLTDKGAFSSEWMNVSIRYKEPEDSKSQLISFPISRQCYTKAPNCDTLFAAYVAECGMIINRSEYIDDDDISDVARKISKLDLSDEYKEEFLELIRAL